MEQTILRHMETVRGITEKTIEKIPEAIADIVPPGFANNIRWNFGHIAVVQEKLVLGVLSEEMGLPEAYGTFFAPSTKPEEWKETPPTLAEIAEVLKEQKRRIAQFIPGRWHDKLPTPFTNRAGITFYTVGETLLFSFYHEAMHIETIKRIYRALPSR
ncbi:putative damage-inducible protein DinB [Anoxybacillus voinovskiensis]|uniref:Putative damage-inducible protein DinB n=1 Tax=Anoxybacteroides voinovskiense TaxID=230470 RepID=A0A840DWG0_9BACL|nr:DinB family protein [Anoxybacillus voinovskiensis]MBB4073849.1 putative damage-inducible protein DinB [Anoxybacillus voinovskiensis]GGJ66669.1 hypothetical protein GCM10008982_14920 [Anoxybacillus voinovskiensis]